MIHKFVRSILVSFKISDKLKLKFNKNILISLIIFLILAFSLHVIMKQTDEHNMLEQKQEAMHLIANTANILDQQLSMSLSATKALALLIQHYGDIPDFDSLSKQMIEIYGGIRCLQLAPGGIITKCYPLKGNEKVIGRNLLISPTRKTESFKAIESGELTLAGPFQLSQGGTGTIGRYPVFNLDKKGNKYFWGFTIVVIDLPELLEKSGIGKLEKAGYDHWFWRIHPDSKTKDIFASSVKTPAPESVIDFSIKVPNGNWTLSVIPKQGWIDQQNRIFWYIGFVIISFIIALFSYIWFERNDLLKKQTKLLKQSEQFLIEANAAKDTFFSIIAHDLRGPVGSLLTLSQILYDEYHDFDEEERKQFIAHMNSGSVQTLALLDNLLLWARSQKGTLECHPIRLDINETINSIAALYENTASNKQQKITIETDGQKYVFVDKDMITTVFRNLISNAIKFSPNQANILISSSNQDNLYCEIKFQDFGVGISPERLVKLFELENTQSTRGTDNESGSGLGLVLCKEFVEKNNGKIKVESQLDKGSTFTVILPLSLD